MKLHFHNLTALGGHDRGYALYVASPDGSPAKPSLGSDVYQIKNSPAAVRKSHRACFMVVDLDGYIIGSELTYAEAVRVAESNADSQAQMPDVDPIVFMRFPCVHHSAAPTRSSYFASRGA